MDVQNLFYSAKSLHSSKINFKKLLERAVVQRILIRAIAYIVQKAGVDQSAFIEALRRSGYEVKSKDLKVRADGTAKGDWDMGIAIDSIAIARSLWEEPARRSAAIDGRPFAAVSGPSRAIRALSRAPRRGGGHDPLQPRRAEKIGGGRGPDPPAVGQGDGHRPQGWPGHRRRL